MTPAKILPTVVSALTGIVVAGIGFTFCFWLWGSSTPLTVTKAVAPPSVVAGTNLIYTVTYCRSYGGDVEVTRTIVGVDSGLIIESPRVTSSVPPHCGTTPVPILIPLTTPPGLYRVRVSATFLVNPVRTITYRFSTTSFAVTAR